MQSMLDLSTRYESDEVIALTETIQNLQHQLMSAHTEIEILNLENEQLNKTLREERQKTIQFKEIRLSVGRNDHTH